jgi:hypothetical protein
MPEWLLIALILLGPFVLSAIGLITLRLWRNPKLDDPLNLGRAWQRLLSLEITPRKFVGFVLLVLPILFLDRILGFIPTNLLPLGLLVWVGYKLFKRQSQLSTESQEILEALNGMTSKLGETRSYLEHVANLVRAKQLEIDDKDRIKSELEKQIGQKTRESEEWNELTGEQQELVIGAIRRSQKKGLFGNAGIVIGSITLNIIASLIWTLLGNPGRDEVLRRLNDMGKWFGM